MTALLLAFGLGFAAGLRVFTPVAAVLLVRNGLWGILAAVGLVARAVSGAIVGWVIAATHGGSGPLGAAAGIIGAMIGAYGGLAVRLKAIPRIGNYPSGIAEDLVAIGLAAFIITR